jgi:hypothetical protein
MNRDAANFQLARPPTVSAPTALSPHQLAGRHARLERELAQAFSTQPWPGALIDRLANELAETEHEMAKPNSKGSSGT